MSAEDEIVINRPSLNEEEVPALRRTESIPAPRGYPFDQFNDAEFNLYMKFVAALERDVGFWDRIRMMRHNNGTREPIRVKKLNPDDAIVCARCHGFTSYQANYEAKLAVDSDGKIAIICYSCQLSNYAASMEIDVNG